MYQIRGKNPLNLDLQRYSGSRANEIHLKDPPCPLIKMGKGCNCNIQNMGRS